MNLSDVLLLNAICISIMKHFSECQILIKLIKRTVKCQHTVAVKICQFFKVLNISNAL